MRSESARSLDRKH